MQGLKDNKLETTWKWFFESLKEFYPNKELQSVRRIIFEDLLNITEINVISDSCHRITETEIVKLIKAIKKLKEFVPVQYITGKSYFLGHFLRVDPDVLIPRPETEELVLLALKKIDQNFGNFEKVRVLDIGTGSGCIAVSIASSLINAEVTAIDISEKALEIAKTNAKEADVSVLFKKKNILTLKTDDCFDVIISNPPYVKNSEKQFMQANVLKYEPDIALYVEDSDPLIFYRNILEKAKERMLTSTGIIILEFNENHKEEMYELIRSYDFRNIQIHEDFRGKPRFAFAQKE